MANCLVLVRHARPSPDYTGRLVGASDLPLDSAGRVQAAALAARIGPLAPACSFCSPLLRCRQTAEAIGLATPLEIDRDLREIDFGRWENRRFEQVAAEEPELVRRWAAFAPDFAFPGGEGLAAFVARVGAAADRLTSIEADTVLAVTHGGVIRTMICHLLGLEPRNYVLFEVDYAAVVILHCFGGKGVLAFPSVEPAGGPRHG